MNNLIGLCLSVQPFDWLFGGMGGANHRLSWSEFCHWFDFAFQHPKACWDGSKSHTQDMTYEKHVTVLLFNQFFAYWTDW